MSADIHIDEFNRDSAIAILRLYNSFPHPMALYVDDITRVDDPDEYGVISDRHQRCIGALLWLAEEKIIRYRDTIGFDGIEQAIISLPALQALHHVPDRGTAVTLVNLIRDALRDKSSEALKQVMLMFYERFLLLSNKGFGA
jgi:hypothetical protein